MTNRKFNFIVRNSRLIFTLKRWHWNQSTEKESEEFNLFQTIRTNKRYAFRRESNSFWGSYSFEINIIIVVRASNFGGRDTSKGYLMAIINFEWNNMGVAGRKDNIVVFNCDFRASKFESINTSSYFCAKILVKLGWECNNDIAVL